MNPVRATLPRGRRVVHYGLGAALGLTVAFLSAIGQETGEPGQAPAGPKAAPTSAPSIAEMLQRAQEALAANELAVARQWYAAVLAERPEHPLGLLGMAEVLRLAGPEAGLQAVDYYRQYLRVRSPQYVANDGQAHFGLGMVYLGARHYRLAKESLLRAYKLAPRDPERVINLALACAGLKQRQEALRLGLEALQLAPDDLRIRRHVANFQMAVGDDVAALRTVQQGIAILRGKISSRPDDVEAIDRLREFQGMRLQILNARAEKQPDDAQLWLQISRGVQDQVPVVEMLMFHEALKSATRAAEHAPDDPMIRINQARLLYLVGQAGKAEQALQAIRSAGRTGEALALVEAQLQARPDDAALKRIQRFMQQPATTAPSSR